MLFTRYKMYLFSPTNKLRVKAMLISKIKLISTVVVAALLLPLTVHATVIVSQASSQDMSSLALLVLGVSSLALGRRFSQQQPE